MTLTEQEQQLHIAADILQTGHPFNVRHDTSEKWHPSKGLNPARAVLDGWYVRPILATPPDNRPIHNPDSLTAEQVGIGYRLGLQDESANQPHEYWGGEWLQGTPSTVAFGSFQVACRVPLTVPWPEAKPDPYAELKATHAAGKVIQYRDANSGGAWSGWRDYDGGRGMAAPMPIDNNGGYREWRVKPEPPSFQLPPPPPGMRWHHEDGWNEVDLPQGYRPLVDGEELQPGDDGDYGDGFMRFSGGNRVMYPQYLYRTTRPLMFVHEGKEWTYHRTGDPMPCDEEARIDIVCDTGKSTTDDGDPLIPRTARHNKWDKTIRWRYAETTKPIELGPEDVPPGSVFRRDDWHPHAYRAAVTVYEHGVCIGAGIESGIERTYEDLKKYKYKINRPRYRDADGKPTLWEPCYKIEKIFTS